jgi:hypothetical protein
VTVLALALSSPAAAQATTPLRLVPPPPGAGPAIPETASPPAPAQPVDETIKATPLAPVDAAWIGTLSDTARPLPQSMWQGTPRTLVAAALPLVAPSTSPTLQDLARRLLLSNAIAPAGQDEPDHPALAALRVDRLMALGEVGGALAVLETLPSTLRTDELDRRRVELRFAANDAESGCREVQNSIARYQSLWWDRALIACQALAGDQAKASLGLDLLHEQKAPPDTGFDALVHALGGRAVKLDKLARPTPMLMTLLAAAKMALPADAVAAADLTSLRGWVGNEAVPPIQRLAAAERAAMLGAIPPEALADLYAKVEFKPEELGAAITQSKAPATPRDRALLYQVARDDPAAGIRATALGALLTEAKKHGAFLATARVVGPILTELPPGRDLGAFAADAARALYAAGRPAAAAPWLALVEPGTAPLLVSLSRLATENPARTGPDKSDGKSVVVAPAAQMTLALALSTAFEGTDDPGAWAPFVAGAHDGSLPSAAIWLDQQQAAAGRRVGETVLTTLILARAGDNLSSEPIVLARVVAGLKAVHLDGEARALALEAALAAGF